MKVWENSKKLWKHSPAAHVPTAFLVLPNLHSCLYNSIENTVHVFYFLNTTQVNSTFHTCWLASSEVISQVPFTFEQPKKNKMAFVGILSQINSLFWPLVIQLCGLYTKTIFHLCHCRWKWWIFTSTLWIIVNYCSPLNFPVVACLKTENDKNLFIKVSNCYGALRCFVLSMVSSSDDVTSMHV